MTVTIMVTKFRCEDLPDNDRGDFRCRRLVDSSRFSCESITMVGFTKYDGNYNCIVALHVVCVIMLFRFRFNLYRSLSSHVSIISEMMRVIFI